MARVVTMAIVHLVAVDHHAFGAILADRRPEVKVFEIGKQPAAAAELLATLDAEAEEDDV
jgi:hypothetical protein